MVTRKTDRFPWACGELPQATPCGISPLMFIPQESHRFPSHHTFVSFSKHPSEIECFWSRIYGQFTIVIGFSSQNRAGLSTRDFEYLIWQGAWGKGETPAGKDRLARPRRALARGGLPSSPRKANPSPTPLNSPQSSRNQVFDFLA